MPCGARGEVRERLLIPVRCLHRSHPTPYLGNGSDGSLQHRGVLGGGDEGRRVGDAR